MFGKIVTYAANRLQESIVASEECLATCGQYVECFETAPYSITGALLWGIGAARLTATAIKLCSRPRRDYPWRNFILDLVINVGLIIKGNSSAARYQSFERTTQNVTDVCSYTNNRISSIYDRCKEMLKNSP